MEPGTNKEGEGSLQVSQNDMQRIEEEINREETFKVDPHKIDENAVFVEESPDKAFGVLKSLASNPNDAEVLGYVKNLGDLTYLIGDRIIDSLGNILLGLTGRNEEIRRAVLGQIRMLRTFLKEKSPSNYHTLIRDIILPVLSRLLLNSNLEVKELAGNLMAETAEDITEEDRGAHILTVVLEMAHNENNEDNRVVAIQLISNLSQSFGRDLCEHFAGFEFLSLGEDPVIKVRKECVINLERICQVVSQKFRNERFLPFFLRMSEDTAWIVRKACVDCIYKLAPLSEPSFRQEELTNVLLRFLKDTNKWVKISAYKHLGAFIYTLKDLTVDDRLIEHFVRMTEPSINNISTDNEIMHACAYNFPAVLTTLGPSKWPLLQKTFAALAKSTDKKVRRPIACALHEYAKLLGPERTASELYPVLRSLLRDTSDEVKYGAIEHLSDFMMIFPEEGREPLIDLILEIQKDQKKWRVRELIARQIDRLAAVFNTQMTFAFIVPISFTLCNDVVSIVRNQASKKIYALLVRVLDESSGYRGAVIEQIQHFSTLNKFSHRQAFARMCKRLMLLPEPTLFEEHFLEGLLRVARDPIPNVRITVAEVLLSHFKKNGPFARHPKILETVHDMASDKSKEVQKIMNHILSEHCREEDQKPRSMEIENEGHQSLSPDGKTE